MVRFGFSIVSVIFGIYMIYEAINKYSMVGKAKKTWLTTSGVILNSGLKVHAQSHSKGGKLDLRYEPQVTYQYQVMNQTYNGDRLGFDSRFYSSEEMNKKVFLPHEGEQVTVFYDPADPSKAVLKTKTNLGMTNLGFGIILVVAGLFGVFTFFPK